MAEKAKKAVTPEQKAAWEDQLVAKHERLREQYPEAEARRQEAAKAKG